MSDRRREFMNIALREAYRGVAAGHGGPFGAVIVKGVRIVARGHNEVLKSNDPTRHAEICAISRAARKLGRPHFKGCDVYTTTEPCVMCFAALNWAQVRRIYFGTTVRDVKKLGFNELVISNRRLSSLGGAKLGLVPGFMRDECQELLEHWQAQPGARVY